MRPIHRSIALEVVKNGLDTIADEMALIIMRTAYSSIVRDFDGLLDRDLRRHGRDARAGPTTPLHLGSFHDAMQRLIANTSVDTEPGDVFIGNDPYVRRRASICPTSTSCGRSSTTTRLRGWPTTLAHTSTSAASCRAATRWAPPRSTRRGCACRSSSCTSGASQRGDLRHHGDQCTRAGDGPRRHARADRGCRRRSPRVRAACSADRADDACNATSTSCTTTLSIGPQRDRDAPDGTYEFTDQIDGLGETPESLPFNVAVTVPGDEVTVDWTGSSPQVKGGINAPVPFTKAAHLLHCARCMRGEVPNCHGFTRPIRVIAPEGTIVNPRRPAACGARGITGFRDDRLTVRRAGAGGARQGRRRTAAAA